MNTDVRNEMVNSVKDAIENGNVEAFANKMVSFMEDTEAKVRADYEQLKNEKDASILAARGYHALTSEETKFYDAVVQIAKTKGATTQSLSDVDTVMPQTIYDEIFAEIKRNHPLIDKVDLVNTRNISAKWLLNTGLSGVAGWGELCAEIDDEIKSGFTAVEVQMNKLSAYMYICLTLLDLGYEWLHRYCVMCLAEALATALEKAIIQGTGSNQPIGMIKQIAARGETQPVPAVTKDTVNVTDLTPATLGYIAKRLSNGGKRKVENMIMVVNPLDAYDKVMPATTVMNAQGEYVRRTAMPLDIVESSEVPQGKAVFGIAKNYWLGCGLGKDGKVTYSDDFKFLDDVRTIKHKIVAGGQAKDDASFIYADISSLRPAYLLVAEVSI